MNIKDRGSKRGSIRKRKVPELLKFKDLQILFFCFCGETGIRTPGTSQFNGFQDRRNRPLCHLSKNSFRECFSLKSVQRYESFLIIQMFLEKNFRNEHAFFIFIGVEACNTLYPDCCGMGVNGIMFYNKFAFLVLMS